MDINSAYPSKYLKASDLQGRNVRVTISHVDLEEVGQEKQQKPILYFQGKDKGMVLNKTNSNKIAEAYGPETDEWRGCELILFEAMVDMKGDTVPALRVRTPQPKDNKAAMPTQRGSMKDELAEDEVPF